MSNKNRNDILLIIFFVVGICALIYFSYENQYKKQNAARFINEIKQQSKPGIDSLQNEITNSNAIYMEIEEKINQNQFKKAQELIETLVVKKQTNLVHVYKGMIYAKQGQYEKAIGEYNNAIAQDTFSLAKSKRADVYVKTNRLDLAMKDYIEVYNYNSDYAMQIGQVFEIKKMNDSALRYYLIYFKQNPNDKIVGQKIRKLQTN